MTGKIPKKKERPGVDRLGRTELHYAAGDNLPEEALRLISAGADVDARDDNDWTPLHFAAQSCAAEIAKLLLGHGANVNAKDSNGNTPISNAVFNYQGDGETIKIIRSYGADPKIENNHGVSTLYLARNSYSEITKNCPVSQFFEDCA
jgi:ankyrin repeat protein